MGGKGDEDLGELAHGLKNSLNTLGLAFQYLDRLSQRDGAGAFQADEIRRLVRDAALEVARLRLVGDVLESLSEPSSLRPSPVDLANLLGEVGARVRSEAQKLGIVCDLDLGASGGALVDPDETQRAIDLLARHVAMAVAPAGQLGIRGRSTPVGYEIRIEVRGSGAPEAKGIQEIRRGRGAGGVVRTVASALIESQGGRVEVPPRSAGGPSPKPGGDPEAVLVVTLPLSNGRAHAG